MDTLIARSPNAEALRAELHRDELFREAAASRLARSAVAEVGPGATAGSGFARRVRSVFAWGQPVAQPECPECA